MANRDKHGRFIKGNTGAPGRPRGQQGYLKALIGVVTIDDWQLACRAILESAKAGDVGAFKALAPYVAGLPIQKLQLSAGDAAVLADLLAHAKQHDHSASDVFGALLASYAELEQAGDNDTG